MKLTYDRNVGAETCSDETAFRSAVEARLGYDPFDDAKDDDAVKVDFHTATEGIEATVRFDSPKGGSTQRKFVSRTRDCSELGETVALSIAVYIDPMVLVRAPTPAASSAAAPTRSTPPPPAVAPPASASTSPPTVWIVPSSAPLPPSVALEPRVFLMAGLSRGTAPASAWGIGAGAGIRRGWGSLNLEGRADLPASKLDSDGKGVEASLLLLSLTACAHRDPLFACGLLSGGSLMGHGVGVDVPRRDRTFYSSGGVRVGLAIPLQAWLDLLAHLDIAGTLRQTTVRINSSDAWTTPVLTGTMQLGTQARF